MAIKDALLPEYDHELATTRRILERVPDADFGWRPHQKSFTLGELATHVANIPFWGLTTCQTTELDLATLPNNGKAVVPESTAALLSGFDKLVADTRAALATCGDSEMTSPWSLKKDGHLIFTVPKVAAIRTFVMNHLIHHRGQLSVYLRLRDVPLPPIYGPSADEQ